MKFLNCIWIYFDFRFSFLAVFCFFFLAISCFSFLFFLASGFSSYCFFLFSSVPNTQPPLLPADGPLNFNRITITFSELGPGIKVGLANPG